MNPYDLLSIKKRKIERLSSKKGLEGEVLLVNKMENWIPRPKGKQLQILLDVLKTNGITIKGTSFDAISIPNGVTIDFLSRDDVFAKISKMEFIEIKTANQTRVKPNFSGYFFALTESEIEAARVLGDRHKVALYNYKTDELLITNVQELIDRAKSKNWQISIQL